MKRIWVAMVRQQAMWGWFVMLQNQPLMFFKAPIISLILGVEIKVLGFVRSYMFV